MMDFLPPGFIVRVVYSPFPRYAIQDGTAQWWCGEQRRWSSSPSDALLFCREMDAMTERNRHCLGDSAEVFAATILLTVHHGRWSRRDIVRHLRRHREFFIGGPVGKEGLLLEIVCDTLKKVKP